MPDDPMIVTSGAATKLAEDIAQEMADATLPWYRGLSRYAWLVLIIAMLGWLFDTMDQNVFNLVRTPAVASLLHVARSDRSVTLWGGVMTSVFLVGWATGGLLFGMLGDRLGRTRTMIYTILIYAVFTGMSGLAHNLATFGLFRFLTALGVGGEWAAGAAMVAEVFPARSRARALGALQAASGFGNMMAALITLTLANVAEPTQSWRWAFAIGALPALLVIWIRSSVREPQRWQQARDAAERSGVNELGAIGQLFADPVLRRNTIAATLMAVAGVGGFWGIGVWTPELTRVALIPLHLTAKQSDQAKSVVYLVQNAGAIFGAYLYAVLAERFSRRGALALFFLLAFSAVEGMFGLANSYASLLVWAPILGFCTLGPFAAYTVYFPELFPTRLRATGCGFCYNCARLLAAAAPFILGNLADAFRDPLRPDHGFRMAAAVVACIYFVGFIGLYLAPETRGMPLPQ
jgi:MFS family permease